MLTGQVFESFWKGSKRWPQFFRQIVEIGFRSQLVVIITGGFTAAVLTAQALFQFKLVGYGDLGRRSRQCGDVEGVGGRSSRE